MLGSGSGTFKDPTGKAANCRSKTSWSKCANEQSVDFHLSEDQPYIYIHIYIYNIHILFHIETSHQGDLEARQYTTVYDSHLGCRLLKLGMTRWVAISSRSPRAARHALGVLQALRAPWKPESQGSNAMQCNACICIDCIVALYQTFIKLYWTLDILRLYYGLWGFGLPMLLRSEGHLYANSKPCKHCCWPYQDNVHQWSLMIIDDHQWTHMDTMCKYYANTRLLVPMLAVFLSCFAPKNRHKHCLPHLQPVASGWQLHMHWYSYSRPRGKKYAISLLSVLLWIIIIIYLLYI